MDSKSKAKKAIEKLFSEKLQPAIEPSVTARQKIQDTRKKLAGEIESFKKTAAETEATIQRLQEEVDTALLKGGDPNKILHSLTVEQNRLQAYNRYLSKLSTQDSEAVIAENAAEQALAEAIASGLMDLRPNIEATVWELLNEALGVLVFFEDMGLAIGPTHGLTIDQATERNFSRFSALDQLVYDGIRPYVQGELIIEEVRSVVKRHEARERYLAGQ